MFIHYGILKNTSSVLFVIVDFCFRKYFKFRVGHVDYFELLPRTSLEL